MGDPKSDGRHPTERIDQLLANNLVTARLAAGWTQEALSAASRISRATIAQLESGDSDPRLSTIAAIASAIGLPPAFFLLGRIEVLAIANLPQQLGAPAAALSPREARQIEAWVQNGNTRERAEIAKLATARIGVADGEVSASRLLAAVFAAFLPDPGLAIGAALGAQIDANRADASLAK